MFAKPVPKTWHHVTPPTAPPRRRDHEIAAVPFASSGRGARLRPQSPPSPTLGQRPHATGHPSEAGLAGRGAGGPCLVPCGALGALAGSWHHRAVNRKAGG